MGGHESEARSSAQSTSAIELAVEPMNASELESTFANSLDVVAALDLGGRILRINRSIGGREPSRLVDATLVELVEPDFVGPLSVAIDRIRRSGDATRLDVAVTIPGAAPTWHQLSLSPIRRNGTLVGVAVIAADITIRKDLEHRLLRAEALLVDTQGTAHLGTWDWDITEPNAVWSAELFRIYGTTPEEYTPTYEGYLQKVHPDDRAHVIAATEGVFQRFEPYSHDERIMRPDGSIRYLHTWAHAILSHDGKLERLVGVCQDITDRKHAEIALEQRAAELAEANERLRVEITERARVESLLRRAQKLEAIGRLTGGIAHDLNNVLGVVSGYASILYERYRADAPERAYLSDVLGAVERGARMVKQLLSFSREQSVKHGPVAVDRVVEDLSGLLSRLIGADVELTSETRVPHDARGLFIDGNRSQVEQVVMNLAVNARDAMPNGGTLTVATDSVRLSPSDAEEFALPAGEYVHLSVRDTGFGMSDEVQAHIFDPFFTTKEEGRGTGLGLSTVFGVARQHGGAVSVTSAPGAGSTFHVYFPRVDPSAPEGADMERDLRVPRGSETVLLVEDQDELRRMIREALASFGYQVLDASDAAAALEIAKRHEKSIDILLTDIVMPRMSGSELAELVCQSRPGMRVLFMSGYSSDMLRGTAARVGSGELLLKPFTPGELAGRIRSVLDSRPNAVAPPS